MNHKELDADGQYLSVLSTGVILFKGIDGNKIQSRLDPTEEFRVAGGVAVFKDGKAQLIK